MSTKYPRRWENGQRIVAGQDFPLPVGRFIKRGERGTVLDEDGKFNLFIQWDKATQPWWFYEPDVTGAAPRHLQEGNSVWVSLT